MSNRIPTLLLALTLTVVPVTAYAQDDTTNTTTTTTTEDNRNDDNGFPWGLLGLLGLAGLMPKRRETVVVDNQGRATH